jgi:hypothetical protein
MKKIITGGSNERGCRCSTSSDIHPDSSAICPAIADCYSEYDLGEQCEPGGCDPDYDSCND